MVHEITTLVVAFTFLTKFLFVPEPLRYSVDKKVLVADFAFIWDSVRLSYNATYRTKEFKGQDGNSLFGGVSLAYNF
ncbi:MAG: DUF2219 family protein [Proteobacteria bacterium]|nr:DUF2219 family protein [Pseudomonadota bacterium]